MQPTAIGAFNKNHIMINECNLKSSKVMDNGELKENDCQVVIQQDKSDPMIRSMRQSMESMNPVQEDQILHINQPSEGNEDLEQQGVHLNLSNIGVLDPLAVGMQTDRFHQNNLEEQQRDLMESPSERRQAEVQDQMDAIGQGSEKPELGEELSPQNFKDSQSPMSSHRSQASSFIEKMKENGEKIKIRKISAHNRRNSQVLN